MPAFWSNAMLSNRRIDNFNCAVLEINNRIVISYNYQAPSSLVIIIIVAIITSDYYFYIIKLRIIKSCYVISAASLIYFNLFAIIDPRSCPSSTLTGH